MCLNSLKHKVFGSSGDTRLQYWYCIHSSNGFKFSKCYFVDPEMLTPNPYVNQLLTKVINMYNIQIIKHIRNWSLTDLCEACVLIRYCHDKYS